MNTVNKIKVGFVVGGFVGLIHLVWVVLVWLGWAQPLMDFVFRMHLITPVYQIALFHLGTAIGLVALATVIGYIVGMVFGAIWNKVHRAN